MMKRTILVFIFIFAVIAGCFGQNTEKPTPEILKVEADAAKGFSYSYFLFVPPAIRKAKVGKKLQTILVLPNNSGKINDDLSFHEADAKRRVENNSAMASQLGVIIMMPAFPRPESDWKIYTHSLDRDSLLTDKKEYKRFDLQLVKMIDDARAKLKAEKIKTDKKVLMMGFSASGMFTNRFTFLHPKRVKAAVIGSPGGWAIAPVADYNEKLLSYPIGTGDFNSISGKSLDLKNLRKVPMFIFLGDKDENDSVVFRDGYEDSDEKLIFELFGKTPVGRWEISKKLYQEQRLNATFKLYKDVEHTISKEMREDIIAFLQNKLN